MSQLQTLTTLPLVLCTARSTFHTPIVTALAEEELEEDGRDEERV